jgi:hypothetical protein
MGIFLDVYNGFLDVYGILMDSFQKAMDGERIFDNAKYFSYLLRRI